MPPWKPSSPIWPTASWPKTRRAASWTCAGPSKRRPTRARWPRRPKPEEITMQRRSLLHGLRALALTPFPALAATIRKQPVVTGLEVFRVHINKRGDWVLPRLKAEGGLTGLGDASHGGRDAETLRWLDHFA